jgi:hypothetical protein
MRGCLVRLLPVYEVLLDRDGKVLQHIVGNRPVKWHLDGPRDFFKRTDFLVAALNAFANALLLLINWRRRGKELLLVNPHARDDGRLSFTDDDIMAPNLEHLRRRFDAIRVANLQSAVRPAATGGRAVWDDRVYRPIWSKALVPPQAVRIEAPILVKARPIARSSLHFVHDQFANGGACASSTSSTT